ncbi:MULTISPECIES: L,D-transpeptidase family protein [unclassified Vibrio]|uniref:L,D-transpeptidase family protein n=1 Tax=unclassified Vibrio TaxID=2614977 RepID=UPI001E302E41|nr:MULTISPECIES: L,D-transpeptidase family protein [unclassified Vibrio]
MIIVTICALSSPTYSQSMLHSLGWVDSSTPIEQTFRYPQTTESVYAFNHHQLIWLQPHDRQLLEDLIEMATLADISPFFEKRLNILASLRELQQYYQYDVVATDTLLALVSYQVLLNENKYTWLYGQGLPKMWASPPIAAVDALKSAISNQKLTPYLMTLGADSAVYREYQSAIDDLKGAMLDAPPLYNVSSVVRVGETLPDKEVLFTRLDLAGLVVAESVKEIDWYGQALKKVVVDFQRQHGLSADGIIGPKTVEWLNYPIEERIRRLALNAERSRLWPTQRQALVLVNLPSFDLNYYYKGRVAFSSKVIVGKQSRKTPLLEIKMDSMFLNPTWNVPPKIMREDIIPKLRYNPGYLSQKGIQVIKGWGNPVVVDHAVIQWRQVNPKTFPFRMRQLSGKHNALGVYKFNTPNRRAIYLHDTPSKHLFDKPSRAFSSGCIRVQHADKFAHSLSKTQGFRKSNISPVGQKANARIPLKRRLPVHLIYKTSWVESGRIFIRHDIYGYDGVATKSQLVNAELANREHFIH